MIDHSSSENPWLYTGGLAETVPNPSRFTFSFLSYWFSGKGSLGKALDLFHIPHTDFDESVVVLKDGATYVDLRREEALLYRDTMLAYKSIESSNTLPSLTFSLKKAFSIRTIVTTFSLVRHQIDLISHPEQFVSAAQGLVEKMPSPQQDASLESFDEMLSTEIWPRVIAVGLLAEFYLHYVGRESRKQGDELTQFITRESSKYDWIVQSLRAMFDVKSGKLSFEEFMDLYGLRADQDYEILCPRWYEQQDVLRKRISGAVASKAYIDTPVDIPAPLTRHVDAAIQLQIQRSLARKHASAWINAFRQKLLSMFSAGQLEKLDRESLLLGKKTTATISEKSENTIHADKVVTSGQGMPLSPGRVEGVVKHISSVDDVIPPGTIAVIPNASPEFSILYPRCSGIIFLTGGQTSHGAIVTREYKIPALTDSETAFAREGARLRIDGGSGAWSEVEGS